MSKGSKTAIGSPELSKKNPKIKECQNAINFSSSTPAKLNNSNGKRFTISGLKFSKNMDEDESWWSDDETDRSNTVISAVNCKDSTKSLSLPATNTGLQQLHEAEDANESPINSYTSADTNSTNQLSSSVKSCDDASAFESFSCTDEDEDEHAEESDPDTTSIESTSLNNRYVTMSGYFLTYCIISLRVKYLLKNVLSLP